MKRELKKSPLVVKASTIHGFGVFANANIAPGRIIEECYLIPSPAFVPELLNYYFDYKDQYAVAFGYASIYNHSPKPNALREYDAEEPILILKANTLIRKGEEIFIDYGENWFNERALTITEPTRSQNKLIMRLLLRSTLIIGLLATLIYFSSHFHA